MRGVVVLQEGADRAHEEQRLAADEAVHSQGEGIDEGHPPVSPVGHCTAMLPRFPVVSC